MQNTIKIRKLIKNLILFLSIITGLTASNTFATETLQSKKDKHEWPFDTRLLRDSSAANAKLIQEGFVPIDIDSAIEFSMPNPNNNAQPIKMLLTKQMLAQVPSEQLPDKARKMLENQSLKIKGLFLERPNSRATIIFTAGFLLGNKEFFAPFIEIAPKDCNLLFIELRAHGESQGKSLSSSLSSCTGLPDCCSILPASIGLPDCINNSSTFKKINFGLGLKEYGLHEHNDIIGAIAHTSELTKNKPIILFGWCSGAFHSARALIELKTLSATTGQDLIKQFNVQGLIFDSGFGSLAEVATRLNTYVNKNLNKEIDKSAKKDNCIVNKSKKGAGFATKAATGFASWFFTPSVRENDPETQIANKMEAIADIKTLFIHSKQDSFAKIEEAKKLAAKITDHDFCEFEGDNHVRNHLENPDQYKAKLEEWLNKTIKYVAPEKPNTENNGKNTENKAKLNKNIKRMIEIIDTIIDCIKTNKQPEEKLVTEFVNLLQDPKSGVPPETQAEIMQKLQKSFSDPKTPKEEQIKTLEAIKDILNNIKPGQKTGQQDSETNKDENGINDEQKNNRERDRDKDKYYGQNPDYKNPQQYMQNPNGATQPTSISSPSSSSNNGPSSGPGYSGPDRSNSNGSSGPSGSHSPSRGSGYNGNGYNGFGDNNWSSGSSDNNKEDKDNETPNLTAGEYFMLDEKYGPEMRDKPDRRYWFSR